MAARTRSSGATSTPRLDLAALLTDPATRIVVCCGAGGVGKTTTAAALGLWAAEHGRKVVVLTIDPARRLAQSLGLTELDNTPRPVAGVDEPAGGSLDAMMLDMKRTFDEVVEQHATPDKAAQILANPFYQAVSSSFAGTQEYMAMEKLGQLRAEADRTGRWDLIVVDTPPSRSALDFLDAPKRLGSFLDGRFIRLMTAPAKAGGRAGFKVFSVGRHDGDEHDVQGARWPAAPGRADLRGRPGHDVRRVPRARRPHLRPAQGPRDGLRRRRRPRARRPAGGVVLRRTPRRGADAARRPGGQPHPAGRGAVPEGRRAPWRRPTSSPTRTARTAAPPARRPRGCCACTPPSPRPPSGRSGR